MMMMMIKMNQNKKSHHGFQKQQEAQKIGLKVTSPIGQWLTRQVIEAHQILILAYKKFITNHI
jgi:hypothetical protein